MTAFRRCFPFICVDIRAAILGFFLWLIFAVCGFWLHFPPVSGRFMSLSAWELPLFIGVHFAAAFCCCCCAGAAARGYLPGVLEGLNA